MIDIKEFEKYLLNQPSLMYSTIRTYKQIIKNFLLQYDDPELKDFNEYISDKSRKHQAHIKYAFKYFFDFAGIPEYYKQLSKVKVRVKGRTKTFLTPAERILLVDAIDDRKFKTVAALQDATGARAREILTITKQDIKIKPERLDIRIRGKGYKTRVIYLKREYLNILDPYLIKPVQNYIFLTDDTNKLTKYIQLIKINTIYKRYEEAIKLAGDKIGIPEVTSHDLRRTFINDLNTDPYLAQQAAGHSNIKITEGYFNKVPENVAKAMLERQSKDD